MKKWNEYKKNDIPAEKEDNEDKEPPKQIGIYYDFLVFDNNDKKEDYNDEFLNCIKDPSLKIWMMINNTSNKTKSRFSSLFEEILENDKKIAAEEKNSDENINDNENVIKNNDNKIINSINIDNHSSNNDNINNININIYNDDNIKDNNNCIINNIDTINNNYHLFNDVVNINNSESLKNKNDDNYILNGKPSELFPYSYSNCNLNIPFIGSSSFEGNKSVYKYYFGPYELKNIAYNCSSGQFINSTNDSENNISSSSNIKSNFNLEKNSFDSYHSRKKNKLNIDIKRIISSEDTRTTIMIKNIPSKFKKEEILKIIDNNFKNAYDIFVLPFDLNICTNYGYCFINFTCSFHIPYFYHLMNGKKWTGTFSTKICEITYSTIQGKNNLKSHYSNKIIFHNGEANKNIYDLKYIIPNEYRVIFNSLYPNQLVEEYNEYFMTKIPFKY